MVFGEKTKGYKYLTLNEREVRASSGIMLLLGFIAFVNGFVLQNFIVIPYIAGFLLINFLIGLFIGSKYAPTIFIGKYFVKKQTPIPIGAIQKKFAWSLGAILATIILILSIMLQNNPMLFGPVCMLCLICLILLYFETVFAICFGCKLYYLAIRLKLIKKPKDNPKCMGDSCEL